MDIYIYIYRYRLVLSSIRFDTSHGQSHFDRLHPDIDRQNVVVRGSMLSNGLVQLYLVSIEYPTFFRISIVIRYLYLLVTGRHTPQDQQSTHLVTKFSHLDVMASRPCDSISRGCLSRLSISHDRIMLYDYIYNYTHRSYAIKYIRPRSML
jgi:hypothetical protein